MTREGYECYKLYLALQRHFSTSYDFFKYNGKVNSSVAAYQKRNDVYSFEKLSKIVLPEDRIDFFVAHFVNDPKCWIGNMSKREFETYKEVLKTFPNKFKDDLEYISTYDPSELMKVDGIPLIHELCINKKVSKETLIAMDVFFPFIDKHANEVKVPFVFPDYIDMMKNYRPFFAKKITDFHKDIMKNVLITNK